MMVIEVGNIRGIPNYRIEDYSGDISVDELVKRLDGYYERFQLRPRYVVGCTNKPLCRDNTIDDIKGMNGVTKINAFVSVLGGKGGFGANLRANKGRSGRQPKRETKDPKTYYKDLKTGVKTKDINKLKKAYEALNEQNGQMDKDKERLQQKKEKLQKAIGYYESVLNGNTASQERFQDTEFLDELDDVMMEVRNSVNSALNLESESDDNWESDWESSGEEQDEPQEGSSKDLASEKTNTINAKPKPKFASFFDEENEEE
ncbi:unnamed protein product [Debaryomyces fabryi]|nr:unnamed protein product [Debaryomyces fabryi]